MPVYNEEGIIEKTERDYYSEIINKLPVSEMIIVNDCPTDDTPAILAKLESELEGVKVLKLDKNGGHGKALRLAYENASLSLVFHTDSNYQFEPKDFWKLYDEIADNDMVIGYRAVRHDPLPRLIITNILKVSNMAIFGFGIRDANSPFKLIRKECLQECLKLIDAPSIMLAVTAKWLGYRVREIPVTHLPRLTEEVSINKWKLLKVCMLSLSQNPQLKKHFNIAKQKNSCKASSS